jgi:hypothetical protein
MNTQRVRRIGFLVLLCSIVLGYTLRGDAIIVHLNNMYEYSCNVWDYQETYYGANCPNPGEFGEEKYCRSGEDEPWDPDSAEFWTDMWWACWDFCFNPSPQYGPYNYSCSDSEIGIYYYYDECFIQCHCISCFIR